MNYKVILEDVFGRILFSKSELFELQKVSKKFISSLKSKKLNAFIGGSFAKGTAMRKRDKPDIDIFVVFDSSEELLNLEKILNKLKLPGKLKVVHGSRDYFQIDCGKILLEVIPVLKNMGGESVENVTDFSLSHVKYVLGEVRNNSEISKEILLAKAFCQAQRCYGAESYIHGFSGYSLEILVIHFGGFIKFLKGVQKVKVIDPKKYFKGKQEILREINSSKLQGPIVLIDPTYKYRNVCAGLNSETFEKFSKSANLFLKSPSLDYFEFKKIDVESLKDFSKKNDGKFVEINLKTSRIQSDVAGAKMKKFFDFFVEELERKKQNVLKKEFDYSGKGKISKGYLVVEENMEIEVRGPPVKLKEAVVKFRKAKGKNSFKKKGYWWFTDKTSVEEIFKMIKKFEKEMSVVARV
jgi:tRNA nucleotidyltransferase (CCA-adding enzyme)